MLNRTLFFVGCLCFFVTFSASAIQPAINTQFICPPCDQSCDIVKYDSGGICPVCSMRLEKKGDYNKTLSRKQIHEDLNILIKTLKTNHPGIYDYRTKFEIDSMFVSYRKEAYHQKQLLSFYEVVSKIVAAVGDAHTYPMNPVDVKIMQEELLFPKIPRIDENQIYLDDRRLESINGHSEKEILKALQAVSNSDGNTLPYKNAWIEMEFPLRYFVSIDTSSLFEVKFKDGETLQLDGNSYFREGFKQNHPDPSFSVNGDTAVIKIPTWEDKTAGSFNNDLEQMAESSELGRFIAEAMHKVDVLNITRLTIDLRGNTGGKSGPAAILLRHLIDHPFKYYQEIRLSSDEFPTKEFITNKELIQFYESPQAKELIDERDGHFYFKPQLTPTIYPVENTYKGKVDILVDKYTLSVSTDVVAILSKHRDVTVTGNEIGGSLQHYSAGNYLNLQLPNSKIEINVPLQRLSY